MVICKKLALHKYERMLMNMAQHSRASGNTLDLACKDAQPLKNKIAEIQQAYDEDFPAPVTPAAAGQVVIHNDASGLLEVRVAATDLDEAAYKEKLAEWTKTYEDHVEAAHDGFVQAHVAIIVDDQSDVDRLK